MVYLHMQWSICTNDITIESDKSEQGRPQIISRKAVSKDLDLSDSMQTYKEQNKRSKKCLVAATLRFLFLFFIR